MEKIKLGKTNLYVNKIGFGGIPIQRVCQSDVNEIILALLKEGINFIDTARGYTVSEAFLGEALKGVRDKFIIATKSMARDYNSMKEDILKSLENLKTDYIDIYQLHNVKSEEEYRRIMQNDGAYKALLEAKDEGKIHYIGITSHNLDFLESKIDLEDFPFSTIQVPYNIVEEKAESLFKKAVSKNIGTIVMKPLAGGAIDNKKLAIKFLLSKDFVNVLIPGMGSVGEVLENVSVKCENLSLSELEEIKKIREDLGQDFCRRCGYCLPCTKGIDIPNCFMFEGYYNRYGLREWALSRYNKLSVKASECIECKKCMKRCPYNLNIIEKLKKVVETLER